MFVLDDNYIPKVHELIRQGHEDVTPAVKTELVAILHKSLPGSGSRPVMTHLYNEAMSYVRVIEKAARQLVLPVPKKPKTQAGAIHEDDTVAEWLQDDVDTRYV